MKCPCKIKDSYHQVVLELVYGLTDAREVVRRPERGMNRPLLQEEAWSRVYQAEGKAAAVNCSRMLAKEGVLKSLEWHRRQKAEEGVEYSELLRRRLQARASARMSRVTKLGEVGEEAWQSFLLRLFRGVENRNSGGEEDAVVYEDEHGKVTATIPPGRAKASRKQLVARARGALLDFEVRPTEEWGEEELEALEDWKETRAHGMVPVFDRPGATKLSAVVEGMAEIKITVQQAKETGARVAREALARLPEALEAMASGDSEAWCRERFSALAEEATSEEAKQRWSGLAASATGEPREVEIAVLGG